MNAPFDLTKAIALDATSHESPLIDRQRQPAQISRKALRRSADWCSPSDSRAAVRAADAPKYGADGMPHGWVDSPLVFVAIGEDGIVSIVCHRSEMGQGVRTGMPMIVADELEADWTRVRVVQATGDEERYGNQDTDGSRSTRHFFMPMRRCGAAARQMLEAAAAARWKVPVSEVQAKNGEVIHTPTGRKLGYGALAKAAASMPLPAADEIKLKDPSQFRYIGTGKLKLVDAQDIATGKAQYGMDTRLPGHALRRSGAAASVRRQGHELRRRRGAEGAGRRASRADRRHAGRARSSIRSAALR